MTVQTENHQLLASNPHGRDFVLADLHGHRSQLEDSLAERAFDPKRDRLLSVGDLIDRGPDSLGCLALLDEPWFYAVRGNHEQMLIDAVQDQNSLAWSRWLMNGGNWALDCADAQLQYWAERLQALPYSLTVSHGDHRIGVCHAQYRLPNWDDRLSAGDYDRADWMWGRSRLNSGDRQTVAGVDWIFHGHTIVPSVAQLGNSVFIDRGAYNGGPLVLVSIKDWLDGTDRYQSL
ncbi:hypothetical protein BGP77_04745 [Saccharospirillum sp. MSK14-1]|uniref:metallophosphoesterase n=1 Tax=Saccharospirillum sp. MSK14-1 TaxID=1897632 RepID=UPI000D37AF70|nr:metallophosphoesterase [Saccharospirillum sp. MSK14-1]PTY36607.1 hypothetical protein BGP77_04745 [Saccharospirillum sp. MSK14-1]